MIARTDNEVKSYVDGYNNCFNSFVELLKNNDSKRAIEKMQLLLIATNSVTSELKGENDSE